MIENLKLNPITYLTWSWMKINNDTITVNPSFTENNGKEIKVPEGVTVTTGKSIKTELAEPNYSIGDAAAKLISDNAKDGKIYTIKGTLKEPLIIRLESPDGVNECTQQIIHALPDSKGEVIIVSSSADKSAGGMTALLTKVYLEENADIQISKVQLLGSAMNQIDETAMVQGPDSKANFVQVELGGSHIDEGFHSTLLGNRSVFNSHMGYLCRNEQYLDTNQTVVHKGKKTICDMFTDGTIKDRSTKVYRGTIDMVTGCCGSTGNEMEGTLNLSPDALEKSAPIILCGEDDIAAEHGSTIGKLSKDILFYFQSRGIDQALAEELLSRAKITAAADKIGSEEIQTQISDYLKMIYGN
ncbi:MAG: SufD family Fe-S cluster assembly protein [Treponema sp.]|nr:SufD family Fe-S cluster assembly protein [Treponema sp.]